MSDDLVKKLRERLWRRGGESNDDAAIRRQKEREAGADLIETQAARIAELEEALSGLLKTFEGVGFRIGQTHPPHTASYEEAKQYYATNYQGKLATALFMFQQWCRWKLVHAARAALEGGES